jgi:hypothetical protein
MKNPFRFFISLFFIAFIGLSCLDQVDLPTQRTNQVLVVEGLFSNLLEENFLKLTYTLPVGSQKSIEPVVGAYIELRSNNGEKVIYKPATDAVGIYRPTDKTLIAKDGIKYSIYIKLLNGKEFSSAPESLPTNVPIQKVTARFRKEAPIGYQIFADFQDPKDSENYYRWEADAYHVRLSTGGQQGCCKICYVLINSEGINNFSDAGVNGGLVRLRPVHFSQAYTLGKHFAEVKQLSITRNAYQYWQKYKNQLNRKGTIFDPLPAPVYGNISNINDPNEFALGYFEVASISKSKLEIPGDTLGSYAVTFIINNSIYTKEGDCMLAYPFAFYADKPPKGW